MTTRRLGGRVGRGAPGGEENELQAEEPAAVAPKPSWWQPEPVVTTDPDLKIVGCEVLRVKVFLQGR